METTRKWYLPVQERRAPSVVHGRTTQDFFLRGEEQEASNYENVAFDDAVLNPPKVEFDSFDKIPRKRHPLVTLTALLAIAGLGVLTWRSFGGRLEESSWVRTATRAMVRAQPVAPPTAPAKIETPPPAPARELAVPTPPSPAADVDRPSEEPTRQAAEPAPSVEADEPIHQAEPAPPAEADESIHQAEPAAAAKVKVRKPTVRAVPRGRAKPLRGYVWSPGERALVPAERPRSQVDPAASDRANPEADRPLAPAPEDPGSNPPATTSPPAFRPGDSPNAAPIIE